MRDGYRFLKLPNSHLLNFFASLNDRQLLLLKQFQLLNLLDKLFFIFMHKHNKFEIVNNILVHDEIHHNRLVDFEIAVVNLNHQQTNCQLQLHLKLSADHLLLLVYR